MSRLKKYAKTALCVALSAAMVFMDTPITAFAVETETVAEETKQLPETQDESPAEEDGAKEESTESLAVQEKTETAVTEEGTETAKTEAAEEGTKETETAESTAVSDTSEETATEEFPTEEVTSVETTETMTEEKVTETEEMLTEETDSETETETEAEESIQLLAFSDSDIAHGEYKEDGNNITWVIDGDGKLTVTGKGEFAAVSDGSDFTRAPWYSEAEFITSAVINVTGMKDAGGMFSRCRNLSQVDLSGFDTKQVTNMGGMFSYCSNLSQVELSGFDTSQVTNMRGMFSYCSNLSQVELSGFDTSQVTDMGGMFSGCDSLTSLNLSSFDTSRVTDMWDMFSYCSNLSQVDLSGFDTSRVTDMRGMFQSCKRLTSLDISGFNTSQVTDMSLMFSDCTRLTSLDISSFNTGQVTDMSWMFKGCTRLTSLDLSDFDMRNVTDMSRMFYECSELSSVNLSGSVTSQVTKMAEMFYGCGKLSNVDLSGFGTSQVTDMSRMFSGCASLTSLALSSFNTGQVTNMTGMFYNCGKLSNVDLSGFNTSQVTDMEAMFYGCRSLSQVDVSRFDTGKVTNMGRMFGDCLSLSQVDVSRFNTSKVTNMAEMFYSCESLIQVDVSGFDTSKVTDMQHMFSSCYKLSQADVSGFDTSKVTNMKYMFNSCRSLSQVDVSRFDTSQVTDMSAMFCDCPILSQVDVSRFDTSKVTDMSIMFSGCESLSQVDVSGFDTSKVTDMSDMFSMCKSLTSLDLSSFSVNGKLDDMISSCNGLTTIYTPVNVSASVKLPKSGNTATDDIWYKPDGTVITELPQNLGYSIVIKKNEVPEVSRQISVRKTKTVYSPGETVSLDDLAVIYFDDNGSLTRLKEGYTTNVDEINADMTTLGRKELKVSYEDLTATVSLYVSKSLTENDITIIMPDETYVYDGNPKTPVPTVTLRENDTRLEAGKDFTLSYRNNVEAGTTAAVVVSVQGGYQGTFTQYFTINAAPAPEAKTLEENVPVSASGQKGRTLDLSGCFPEAGEIKGYMIKECREDDTIGGNVLSGTPSINNGVLTYDTSAGIAEDFAEIVIAVDFKNYESSTLTVTLKMKVQNVTITVTGENNIIYSKKPAVPVKSVKVSAQDGTDISDIVRESLTYTYSGTQADGSAYTATADAPINAGNYKLTVSIVQENKNYTGSAEYPFTIAKAPLTITARDMGLKIGAELPKKEDYQFDIAGLLEGDTLITNPTLSCNIADTAQAGEYEIAVSGADAGMNYDITYKNGRLTVSETGESAAYYTVTFNMSGHGSDITNTGIREGSLLEKPQDPQAEGYTFTGWYKDQNCTVLWDFAKDMIQSDTTVYAGWKAKDDNKDDGDKDDDNNDDDSAFADTERTPLSAVSAAIADMKSRVYDGNAYEPTVKVTANVGGKKTALVEGIDYRVLYKDNIKAGTATVTIKGNGIYKGSVSKSYTISPKSVKKLKVITGSIASAQTGAGLTMLPVYVYDGAKRLSYGTDFSLSNYSVTKSAAKVTVTGMGNYTGTVTATLSVYAVDSDKIINPENVEAIHPMLYNAGKAVKPEPAVTTGGVKLTKNKDYKIQYQNNKNAGTAYVIVTGKGAYKGKVVVPFEIKAAQVTSGVTVKPISARTYNGKYQRPAPSVTVSIGGKNKKLVKNKDYTVTYKNNRHAGTAEVIVTGKGNYAGMTARSTFTINPQKITKASIKGTQGNLTLTYSKGILKQGTDYEQPVYGEVQKNKIKVTIKGKGDFTGTMTKSVKM